MSDNDAPPERHAPPIPRYNMSSEDEEEDEEQAIQYSKDQEFDDIENIEENDDEEEDDDKRIRNSVRNFKKQIKKKKVRKKQVTKKRKRRGKRRRKPKLGKKWDYITMAICGITAIHVLYSLLLCVVLFTSRPVYYRRSRSGRRTAIPTFFQVYAVEYLMETILFGIYALSLVPLFVIKNINQRFNYITIVLIESLFFGIFCTILLLVKLMLVFNYSPYSYSSTISMQSSPDIVHLLLLLSGLLHFPFFLIYTGILWIKADRAKAKRTFKKIFKNF